MPITHQLGRRIFKPEQAELGAHARDTQEIFDKIAVVDRRTLEQLYAEPMVIGGLREEPFEIRLARITNLFAPETAVTACTGFVHWLWKPQIGGAQLLNITGLTVATHGQTRFKFSFRIEYRTA